MSGLPILDLVVGMIFIYFLLSIACSSAVELWFAICKTRARVLERWVMQIFNVQALDASGKPRVDEKDQPVTVGTAIANHCITTALSKPGKTTSYFNPEDFVSALLDNITRGEDMALPATLPQFIDAINQTTTISTDLKRTFLMLANEALRTDAAQAALPAGIVINKSDIKSDLDRFREKLEGWYNRNTDRLTGTLKRTKSMPSTLIIGIALTISLNADSVSMSRYLYDHKDEARVFADKAVQSLSAYQQRINEMKSRPGQSGNDSTTIKELNEKITRMHTDIGNIQSALPTAFPIGWEQERLPNKSFPEALSDNWLKHAIGWILTILAISLGAPFWFDLLNRVANLRGTGPKPVVNPDEKSK